MYGYRLTVYILINYLLYIEFTGHWSAIQINCIVIVVIIQQVYCAHQAGRELYI